ncbi:hypothetical protein F3Y22_tig00112738pilonHSYRG00038 [Hibiscus syriacus]|uniref:Uncharacterized protein n=1 Tax=Hibiscus syriacus TaxID=106335 RepID=A0A6A2WTP1_HIBSY|nr:hypothetical protein F3Y22_tig00112738pilonHSYRG00038 [Hibiscus syriacus]
MASYRILAFSALFLILLPLAFSGDFDDLSPALSPFYGEHADQAGDTLWAMSVSVIRVGQELVMAVTMASTSLGTLDYSCQPAPPPVPQKEVPRNYRSSILALGLTWRRNLQQNRYIQACMRMRPGFSNLLNRTYFPCYSQCTLGSDCSRLGIRVEDQQATPDGGKGEPTYSFQGSFIGYFGDAHGYGSMEVVAVIRPRVTSLYYHH